MSSRPTYTNSKELEDVFKQLVFRVNTGLSEMSNKSKLEVAAKVRAIFFPVLFMILYVLAQWQSQSLLLFFCCYALMGLSIVLIFLNLIHDLVHDSIFKSKHLNASLLYIFDIIGANSYIWKKRHAILHHGFPNVSGWDSDIEQASLFKIYPHESNRKIHQYQHWYFSLFYPLYLVNWVFVRDFKDFFNKKQVVRKVCSIPLIEYLKLFFFKAFFFFYTILVPVIFFEVIWWHTILALISMLIVAGVFALIVLLSPHVNTTNEFPLPDQYGKLTDCWFHHQLVTTNDVSLDNWLTRNVMGNFNYHIFHHLFPRLPNVYAPYVTKIIREIATENNLGYRTYPLKDALLFHYQLIRNNAVDGGILDDTM